MRILALLSLALFCGTVAADDSPYQQNLRYMGVDRAHNELGIKGAGVKVGVFSSGANVEHEALRNNYFGSKPDGSFDHNYAWYEGFPVVIPFANDAINIGTFLTGVIVGSTKNIGVAPEAKFMACRSIDSLGRDAPEYHLKCLEFLLNPTDLNGLNPRPELRPDVVYASYCESCFDDLIYRDVIKALRKAGVVIIVGSGIRSTDQNPCTRLNKAPSNYPEVFAVSANGLNSAGNPHLFHTSAAGPAFLSGVGVFDRIKPDASALGMNQISSVYLEQQNLYFPASGSSVAAANVTGIAALVISANPALRHRVRDVEEILRHASDPTGVTSLDCGGEQPTPNFVFGYGNVNAYAAVKRAQEFPYGGCPIEPVDPANCTDARGSQFTVSRRIPLKGLAAKQQALTFKHNSSPFRLSDFGDLGSNSGDYLSLCVYDTPHPFTDDTQPFLKEGFKIPFGSGAHGTWRVTKNQKWLFSASRTNVGNDDIRSLVINARTGAISISGHGPDLPLSRSSGIALPSRVLDADSEVIVQLHSSQTGACWNSTFKASDVLENTATTFVANKTSD